MRKTIFYLVLLAFSFTSFGSMAQQQVKGTVKNKAGESIPGANVVIKGTTTGTVTGTDGTFTINAKPADIL
jgi:hypothetical protein